jgi:hypothetical protein
MYFGTLFCRQKQLTVVLVAAAAPPRGDSESDRRQRDSQQHFLNVLNYLYVASMLFSVGSCIPLMQTLRSDVSEAIFSPSVAKLVPFGSLFFITLYLIVGSLWLWTVYVMYRTFNDHVLPHLALDALDTCEEALISYTESLKKVSRDWKTLHIIRTFAATFFGVFLAYEAAVDFLILKYVAHDHHLHSHLSKMGLATGLLAAGYFGSLWFGFFFAGYVNDHVRNMLLVRIGDMLLNVDAFYKISGNPNKMPVEEAKELLRNLIAIIPSRNIGLEVGGLTIGVQKALTLGTVFSYLISELIKSVGLPGAA